MARQIVFAGSCLLQMSAVCAHTCTCALYTQVTLLMISCGFDVRFTDENNTMYYCYLRVVCATHLSAEAVGGFIGSTGTPVSWSWMGG